mmetsp:Transcript_77894/g.147101  ORF Transcript_77894/g.147101 Transcript_77894/m.147101 type:complete len:215 (-) Transcript_77894:30-674(-)
MPTGVMLRWQSDKGFGFIKPDEGGDDVFCHTTGLADGDGSVGDGDPVTYKIEWDDRKGKDRAVDVYVSGGGGGRKRNRSRSRGGRGGGGRGRDRDDSRSPPRRRGGGGGPGTGVMLRWNGEKGFGFIKPDSGGEDLFCHVTGLSDGDGSVLANDRVEYVEEYDDRKGKYNARQVRVLEDRKRGGRGGGGGRGGRRRDDSRDSRDDSRPPPRRRR